MELHERMRMQNKYTTEQIYWKTGVLVKDAVICVGNHIQRRELKQHIEDYNPVCIVGEPCSGRLTSVIEVADKLGVDIFIDYSGKGFENEPLENPEDIYAIRFNKLNSSIKSYSGQNCRVVIISDKIVNGFDSILYGKPSTEDIKEYERKKGNFPIFTLPNQPDERKLVMKALRQGVTLEEMPERLARWFAFNLRQKNVLSLCSYADQLKDTFFKHALLNTIRYKKSISLKFPIGVKYGSD